MAGSRLISVYCQRLATPVVAAAAAVLISLTVGGCSGPQPTQAADDRSAINPGFGRDDGYPSRGSTADRSEEPTADELEQRTAADVEWLLNHHRQPGESTSMNDMANSGDASGDGQSAPEPIQWIERESNGEGSRIAGRNEQRSNPGGETASADRTGVATLDTADASAEVDDVLRMGSVEQPEGLGDAQPVLTRQERIERLVDDLARRLNDEVLTLPGDGDSETALRELMLLAAGSLIDPGRRIPEDQLALLSTQEREILQQFEDFFSRLGATLATGSDPDAALLNAIDVLHESLRQRAPLRISNVALCTRVRGFGDFDPFEKHVFIALEEQRAIVYLEIENFASTQNQQQHWVTELSQELSIYDDRDGIVVWSEPWQKAIDVNREKRRDFFTVQIITIPKALTVGRYFLKVRLRDETTGAIAEESVPFELVADPRLASPNR